MFDTRYITEEFLTEAAASEEKLTHLEHNEDHVMHGGVEGFNHAVNNLNAVHNKLLGKNEDVDVQVKHDGSPSIVFGRHPETGKFFVASKSAFNATPKINYSDEDIEANHGHAPGLVTKLKSALKHLPKVTPKTGVFQGDIMYTRDKKQDDVQSESGQHHFTPNTITYSTPADSEEGKKIDKAKLGVLVHTAYHGPSFDKLKAEYTPDKSGFGSHSDVHLFDNSQDFSKTTYTPKQQAEFQGHLDAAEEAYRNAPKGTFEHTVPHEEHLKTYINQTVRQGTDPTVEGYKEHVKGKFQKEMDKRKTDKAKAQWADAIEKHTGHVDSNYGSFESALEMHKHLQGAKDTLVHALASHQRYDHSIGGAKAKPEGYVIVRNNRPSKFVDRAEFSKANFGRQR